jgi:hypothetical protein
MFMCTRLAGLALIMAAALAASQSKKPAEARGENESVVINASVYADREAVKELLGDDLGGYYIVLAVEVTPRFGKEVNISRDDFELKTDKDGEHTTPFAPSQIAGRGALVIRETGGGGAAAEPSGPVWGIPGTAPIRLPGQGTNLGSTAGPGATQATVHSGRKEKPNPLLGLLQRKELPEGKTSRPVSGLLYFPMDKQKAKDLELRYNVPDDKIVMRFHAER